MNKTTSQSSEKGFRRPSFRGEKIKKHIRSLSYSKTPERSIEATLSRPRRRGSVHNLVQLHHANIALSIKSSCKSDNKIQEDAGNTIYVRSEVDKIHTRIVKAHSATVTTFKRERRRRSGSISLLASNFEIPSVGTSSRQSISNSSDQILTSNDLAPKPDDVTLEPRKKVFSVETTNTDTCADKKGFVPDRNGLSTQSEATANPGEIGIRNMDKIVSSVTRLSGSLLYERGTSAPSANVGPDFERLGVNNERKDEEEILNEQYNSHVDDGQSIGIKTENPEDVAIKCGLRMGKLEDNEGVGRVYVLDNVQTGMINQSEDEDFGIKRENRDNVEVQVESQPETETNPILEEKGTKQYQHQDGSNDIEPDKRRNEVRDNHRNDDERKSVETSEPNHTGQHLNQIETSVQVQGNDNKGDEGEAAKLHAHAISLQKKQNEEKVSGEMDTEEVAPRMKTTDMAKEDILQKNGHLCQGCNRKKWEGGNFCIYCGMEHNSVQADGKICDSELQLQGPESMPRCQKCSKDRWKASKFCINCGFRFPPANHNEQSIGVKSQDIPFKRSIGSDANTIRTVDEIASLELKEANQQCCVII